MKKRVLKIMRVCFGLSIFLVLTTATSLAQQPNAKDAVIIAGKGLGKIEISAPRSIVESLLGAGSGEEGNRQLNDVYFREYDDKGIQVSYTNKDDKVVAIFFYNKQHRYERMAVAAVKTDKGVGWQSSYEDVKKAYGKPKGDYNGSDWRRVVFEGIDFRFENGVMVRIGIPGN